VASAYLRGIIGVVVVILDWEILQTPTQIGHLAIMVATFQIPFVKFT
jgi:hypothetical protein